MKLEKHAWNIDVDKNGHPDLIIGGSDQVVVFRTKPVISIKSSIAVKDKHGILQEKPEEIKQVYKIWIFIGWRQKNLSEFYFT